MKIILTALEYQAIKMDSLKLKNARKLDPDLGIRFMRAIADAIIEAEVKENEGECHFKEGNEDV